MSSPRQNITTASGSGSGEDDFNEQVATLHSLSAEYDAALAVSQRLDGEIAALSTAIAIFSELQQQQQQPQEKKKNHCNTCSSGARMRRGISCSLRPTAVLPPQAQTHTEQEPSRVLFTLTLHNRTPLELHANRWNLMITTPCSGTLTQVLPLPRCLPQTSFSTTFSLPVVDDDVVVLLHFQPSTVPYTGADGAVVDSLIALVDVFPVDILHVLWADAGAGAGSSAFERQTSIASNALPPRNRLEIRLQVPKSVFGLHPDPGQVLDVLVRQRYKEEEKERLLPLYHQNNAAEAEIMRMLENQISNLDVHNNNITRIRDRNNNASLSAVIYSSSGGDRTFTPTTAMVSVHPSTPITIGRSFDASASPHAFLDIKCDATDLVTSLKLHQAMVERIQRYCWGAQATTEAMERGGIRLPNGVLVPSLCSSVQALTLDDAQLGELEQKIEGLRRLALGLLGDKGEVNMDTHGSDTDTDCTEKKKELLCDVIKASRDIAGSLPIRL